jgi:hypothetical protein
MDTSTWKSSPTSLTGVCRESDKNHNNYVPREVVPSHPIYPIRNVAHAEWPRSGDGTLLYLGYGGVALNKMSAAKELRVINTAKWVEAERVQTSVPFWSAVISQDGNYIYAIAPESHGIVILDAHSLQQIRMIAVGNTPSLAIVAPGFAARNHGQE